MIKHYCGVFSFLPEIIILPPFNFHMDIFLTKNVVKHNIDTVKEQPTQKPKLHHKSFSEAAHTGYVNKRKLMVFAECDDIGEISLM